MNPSAFKALKNLKKLTRDLMVEHMRSKKGALEKKEDIPSVEDPNDELSPDDGEADEHDDIGNEEGFDEEYPQHDDEDMEDEELPAVVISSSRRASPIKSPEQFKRGPGRPRKV